MTIKTTAGVVTLQRPKTLGTEVAITPRPLGTGVTSIWRALRNYRHVCDTFMTRLLKSRDSFDTASANVSVVHRAALSITAARTIVCS